MLSCRLTNFCSKTLKSSVCFTNWPKNMTLESYFTLFAQVLLATFQIFLIAWTLWTQQARTQRRQWYQPNGFDTRGATNDNQRPKFSATRDELNTWDAMAIAATKVSCQPLCLQLTCTSSKFHMQKFLWSLGWRRESDYCLIAQLP